LVCRRAGAAQGAACRESAEDGRRQCRRWSRSWRL